MWRVWCGLLLAPAAWTAMEFGGYYLGARSCDAPGGTSSLSALHPRLMLTLLALLFIAVAVVGLVLAVGNRRRYRDNLQHHRVRFLATASVTSSAVFLGGIVLFGAPALVLDICSQARW